MRYQVPIYLYKNSLQQLFQNIFQNSLQNHLQNNVNIQLFGKIVLLTLVASMAFVYTNIHPVSAKGVNTPLSINELPDSFPNDPFYMDGRQYALDHINIRGAWEYTSGDSNLIVATIDTGIDFNHPEFTGRIHPDAVDFLGQGSAMDYTGHGTQVAGVIVADADNQEGIAGIASNVQLLPLKVSPGIARAGAVGPENQVAKGVNQLNYLFHDAIRYGADPARGGTKVMNINFAVGLTDNREADALTYALENDTFVVASTGNLNDDAYKYYPAAYNCVLGVGATDENQERWVGAGGHSGSNYGFSVDVVAPGKNILTTNVDINGSLYARSSGTSMATPHVSGLIALLRSQRPELTVWDIREIVQRTTKDLGEPGFDYTYGFGLIDATAAMELATIWRAGTGQSYPCLAEYQRIVGSLYHDINNNGERDVEDRPFTEDYTNISTYVELYGKNGAVLISTTFPDQNGVYAFNIPQNPAMAPYTLKLSNANISHSVDFAEELAGPYHIAISGSHAAYENDYQQLTGSLFMDTDGDGNKGINEQPYANSMWSSTLLNATPPTLIVELYTANGQRRVAYTEPNEAGEFTFYIDSESVSTAYDLQVTVQSAGYEIPISPTSHLVQLGQAMVSNTSAQNQQYDFAVDATLFMGQSQNAAPLDFQSLSQTGETALLAWQPMADLGYGGYHEVSYATTLDGPYAVLGTTRSLEVADYQIEGLEENRTYYFRVRSFNPTGVDADVTDLALWSQYSEVLTVTIASEQRLIYLPIIEKN